MAATVEIREMTASTTGYDRTSQQVRFYSADATATNALSDPITIPSTGSAWSFTKFLRFYLGGTPPSNFLASLKFYSDESLWGGTTASYVLVEYDKSATGIGAFPSAVASIIGTDINTPGVGDPATLGVLTATYSGTTSYFGSILRLQMEVGNEASPGTLSNETLTFSYDEQ